MLSNLADKDIPALRALKADIEGRSTYLEQETAQRLRERRQDVLLIEAEINRRLMGSGMAPISDQELLAGLSAEEATEIGPLYSPTEEIDEVRKEPPPSSYWDEQCQVKDP